MMIKSTEGPWSEVFKRSILKSPPKMTWFLDLDSYDRRTGNSWLQSLTDLPDGLYSEHKIIFELLVCGMSINTHSLVKWRFSVSSVVRKVVGSTPPSRHVGTLGKSFTCAWKTDVAHCGCLAAKFDSCNCLLSSVHTVLVNIMRCVRLYIKRKYYHYYWFWGWFWVTSPRFWMGDSLKYYIL